ncbi:hypothetical protein KC19_12G106600 [Ceratodon purpureus]|uniref:Origin recognition complex subunit 3 n=1 Tax=Ceratodon purpureus TaxID=3225 RepID=A0A8T0G6H3_CERPU|nr:hypothetical protein KC19_12G106600 [Ceratodon purpureus]
MASCEVLDAADAEEDCLDQVCYVLHAAPPPPVRQPGRPPRPAFADPTHGNTLPPCIPDEPPLCGLWRFHAFHVVWGRLERLIQATLDEQNDASFKEISNWVRNRQFCDAQQQLYRSAPVAPLDGLQPDTSSRGTHAVGSFNKQLHTALLFLGGADPSDHQGTFDGLSTHLKSQNCHVARLVASDFPSKCQVAVPLYSLLRQFLQIQPETADMEILAAWHSEAKNNGRPVVIIVEHMERCSVTALAELIVLLSEWSGEIPIVLILGVATTADVLQRFLPSNALSRLVPCGFTLKSPLERLQSVVRAVLVDSFSAFEISHMVVKHLHMHFLRHDLTVTSFIMSLKVACMEHFCSEPLSFMSHWLLKSSSEADLEKQCAALPGELLEYAARLPSAESSGVGLENMSKQIASSLWRFREQKQLWSVALLCVIEAGKQLGVGFLDLFGQALCPSQHATRHLESLKDVNGVQQPSTHALSSGWHGLSAKLREQTPAVLKCLLEEWKRLTSAVNELHADVCEVYSKFLSGNVPSTPSSSLCGRIETAASAPISPSDSHHPDATKSPLRRPLFGSSLEQTSPAGIQCAPMECSPERAQMASSQGLLTPSKSPSASLYESPRRTSSRLTPSKRAGLESCLPDSPNSPAVRISKSPKTASSPMTAHGSPLRPSTRSLSSDVNTASVVRVRESPRKALNYPAKSPSKLLGSPANSPRKPPKSPAKSPRKHLFSPAKASTEVCAEESPRKKVVKSPKKQAVESEGPQSQQAMSRAELRRMASQNSFGGARVGGHPSNELVADLFQQIVQKYLIPTEVLPLHEIICFKNVSSLQQAMTGATRQKVQLDLLGAQLRLQCECCHPDGSLSNSMHDTCLAYHLTQEHNELINVHDWYQSFSSICCPVKVSSAKKGKGGKSEGSAGDPVIIQARFTRAATELQIAGLLRMPKKGRPDFAQRVCLN